MKLYLKRMLAVVGVLLLGAAALRAQESGALLDALVKKGVLSDQEAEDIRSSLAKDYSQTAGGKLALSNSVQQLKIYGDARLRYDFLEESPQSKAFNNIDGTANQQTRYRYRLRVGADYTFNDNFMGGFELESASASDSANQSFGNQFTKYPINIGLVYLQWKPTDWATLIGGKQHNPFYTTDLLWDADINPEGGSEAFTYHPTDNLSLGLVAGQFIYADNGENSGDSLTGFTNGNTISDNVDIWMFEQQIQVQYNFNKDTFVKIAPGFLAYMGGGNSNLSGGVGAAGGSIYGTGGTAVPYTNVHATDDLAIFTLPGEVDFNLGDIPLRVYGDLAYNTMGKDRIQDVYLFPDVSATRALRAKNLGLGDNLAWMVGAQIGQNKKKGDWSIRGDFRQTGLGSVDPNINDSDFADSYLNQQGFRIQSIYNFTDAVQGSITYYNTWNYKSNLFDDVAAPPAGNAGTVFALDPANTTQRVQVDLLWKF